MQAHRHGMMVDRAKPHAYVERSIFRRLWAILVLDTAFSLKELFDVSGQIEITAPSQP